MAECASTSAIWVVDFRYEGKLRRRFKAFGSRDVMRQRMPFALPDLYGERAQFVGVRKATEEENMQYLRADDARKLYCPTDRHA